MAAGSRNATLTGRLAGADSRILAFLEAWREARDGALVPRRRDFDPARVPALLRFVWIYRDDRQAGDFVCILAGEEINDAWGVSIKGKTLRQVVGAEDHPTVHGRWRQIIDVPLIHYGAASERMSELTSRQAERLLLPLCTRAGAPDHIIGLSLYTIGQVELTRAPLIPEDIVQIPCAEL